MRLKREFAASTHPVSRNKGEGAGESVERERATQFSFQLKKGDKSIYRQRGDREQCFLDKNSHNAERYSVRQQSSCMKFILNR